MFHMERTISLPLSCVTGWCPLCQHSGTPRQSHPTWHKATSFSPNPNWQLEGAEAPSTARAVEGRSWEAPTHRGGTSEETPGSSFKATRKP